MKEHFREHIRADAWCQFFAGKSNRLGPNGNWGGCERHSPESHEAAGALSIGAPAALTLMHPGFRSISSAILDLSPRRIWMLGSKRKPWGLVATRSGKGGSYAPLGE
jgi:hypothetical protein